jgi:hypothetical protein
MILSLISILFVGLIAFIWSSRGFFSALIHLLCTIIAGAIAFAVWEPLGYMMVEAAPTRGSGAALEGMAWGIALGVPFGVSLILLRLVADSFLRSNVVVTSGVNYAGGGVCGLFSGVITTGILVISLGFFRFGSEFMGYQPLTFAANGSLKRTGSLILPVDTLTARLYAGLSERALSTSEPLAKWHPAIDELGAAMRVNFGDGKSRNTVKPNQFELAGRFSVGGQGTTLQSLLGDTLDPAPQNVSDLEGKPFDAGSRIEAFVVKFSSSAGEKSGKVTVGAGQVMLVAQNADESERRNFFPIAVSSQADATSPIFGRWRYDSTGVFISSVGGANESFFGFEFVVPPGFEPIALYVKGVRVAIDGSVKQLAKFPSAAARDLALLRLPQLVAGGAGAISEVDPTGAVEVTGPATGSGLPAGVQVMPSVGFTIQKGMHDPLELDEKNNIVGGEASWPVNDLSKMSGGEKNLRVEKFQQDADTVLVQIDVSIDTPFSLLNTVAQQADRSQVGPRLVDAQGQAYAPIGFILKDEQFAKVRFTAGQPLTTLAMLDDSAKRLSRSSPSDKLTLIFRVSRGAKLKYFAIGTKALATFRPEITVGAN